MTKPSAISQRSGFAASLRRVVAVLLTTLREIFDENAYARFLARREMQPSRASYAAFLEELSCRRERRVKCC